MNNNVQNCDIIKGTIAEKNFCKKNLLQQTGRDGEVLVHSGECTVKQRAQCLCRDSVPVQATDI